MARQLDGGVVDGDASGARVEPHRADDDLARRMAGGASHQRTQAGQQLLHMERFGQIVVGAGVETLDLLAPAIARGEDQHRHAAARPAPALQHRHAVALGQAEIEHDGVIGFGVAQMAAVLAVEGAVHRIAGGFERGDDLAIEVAVVLDD